MTSFSRQPDTKTGVNRFRLTFDRFQLNLRSGELHKDGRKIRLQAQPFQLLALLIEHAGDVVTREEVCQALWRTDTFVDFDHGVGVAVNKIREALGDSAESPRFIETLPKRGYRFIADVQIDEPNSDRALVADLDAGAANRSLPAPQENGSASKRHVSELQPSLEIVLGRGTRRSSLSGLARKHKWGVATVAVLAVASYGVLGFLYRPPRIPFQNVTITQVTDSGNVDDAAISPDGKYLLTSTASGRDETLSLRNIATSSEMQIRVPALTVFSSLAFSPDSNRFYFVGLAGNQWNLYRAPVLGGTPERIAENVDYTFGGVTVSSDGKRVAYVRNDVPAAGFWTIFIADVEGTNKRAVASASMGDIPYPGRLCWSPNGKLIAYSGGLGLKRRIYVLDLGTGETRPFTTRTDLSTGQLAWTPRGDGFLVGYRLRSDVIRWQIGFVSYPDGEFHSISRDTNSYSNSDLTISADGKTFAALQRKATAELLLLPGTGGATGAKSTINIPGFSYDLGRPSLLSWADENDVLLGGRDRLERRSADGSNPSILVSSPNSFINNPQTCDGGRYILFGWMYRTEDESLNIWRANADGSNAVRLTSGKADTHAVCSPDGAWVYYEDDAARALMRVRSTGGRAEVVPIPQDLFSPTWIGLAFSPKGSLLAGFLYVVDPATRTVHQECILVSNYGAPKPTVRTLDVHPGMSYRGQFTPDGKSLVYPFGENGVGNIWVQPLSGAPGHLITNFNSDQIFEVQLSPEGKRLAVVRGHSEYNVVLFRDSSQ